MLSTLYFDYSNKKELTIIFLDIDGVLFDNPLDGSVQRRVEDRYKEQGQEPPKPYSNADCDAAAVDLFDKNAINNLEILINKINGAGGTAAIVLSSDWRLKGDLPYLKKLFGQHSFSNHIIDKTIDRRCTNPDCEEIIGRRHLEIEYWLKNSKNTFSVKNFLIIDDVDYSFSSKFPSSFVRCTNLFTTESLSKSIELLASQSVENSMKLGQNSNKQKL